MKRGQMQAKDLDDLSILLRIRGMHGRGCLYDGFDNTVIPDVPEALAKAKMKSLVKRRLVSGCTCGCRGDFELTLSGHAAVLKGKP